MNNQEMLQSKMPVFEAMPVTVVRYPNRNIDFYLQESENLYQWCQQDKDKLTNVGLNWDMISDIPNRIGALREAQALWVHERFEKTELKAEWKAKSTALYDMLDKLGHALHFAFRKSPTLHQQVTDITNTTRQADAIQSLNSLLVLARGNQDLLRAINFDLSNLDQAANLATDVARLLAVANLEKNMESDAKILRNKAYSHLKEANDELKEYGKYVFHEDEVRLKGYAMAFRKKKLNTASLIPPAGTVPSPAEAAAPVSGTVTSPTGAAGPPAGAITPPPGAAFSTAGAISTAST